MRPIPQTPPRPKANGCLISAAIAGGFVMLLLFGGCTAALVAGSGGATDPPSATPAGSHVPAGTVSATPAATRPTPAHRRHTAHPKRPRPTPTAVRSHPHHHHVPPPPKPRPTPAPTHAHRPVVTPGAFCAHSQAGHVGVSAAGRTYVCRTDAAGRLRWRRP